MKIKEPLKSGINYFYAFTLCLLLLSSAKIQAQNGVTISGQIKDNSGLPLPAVNILEKGTSNGVAADFDGNYTIKLKNQKATLVFTYIGYKSIEIPVTAGKTKIDAVMSEDANSLSEVVVIGYGTVKKGDLTGAVSTLSGGDLRKTPMANVAEALTGKIAGVQITSAEGSPDSDVKIRIRGGGSLTQDGSPLIIVDGFPVNSINDISPSDIESLTVLKDASSTAIYGSRGANGVIIVTTKKGKDGKTSVSANMFYGMKTLANDIDVLSAEDYVNWQYEYAVMKNSKDLSSYEKYFGSYKDQDLYKGLKGDDWQKQVYGNRGEVQSRDFSIRGGKEQMNYNFNYANYQEKAIMVGSDFARNNLSLSLNSKLNDKFDISFTTRYSDTKIDGGGTNEQNEKSTTDSRLRNSIGYSPIPVQGLTTDNTDEAVAGYLVQPFTGIADNDRLQLRKNFNLLGSLSWKLATDLTFKTELGLNNNYNQDYRFYGRSTYYVKNAPLVGYQGMPALIMTNQNQTTFRNANTLNYDFKKLLNSDNHHLTMLVGQELIKTTNNTVTSTIDGFPKLFDFDAAKRLTTQGHAASVDNSYSPDDKLFSVFGRANYDYKSKYLITGTFRADGSSRFLGDNHWGYFPSVAGAWKITEENFMKNVQWLNNLKLRGSFGEAGNNNIPSGQTVQTFYSPTNGISWINAVPNYWATSKTLANPDLKWETTVTRNVGLDFDFFQSRISGSVDVYKNTTKDLLVLFGLPGSGYDNIYRNIGETQNTGTELTLNFAIIQKENAGLSLSFNTGFNTNKINSLGEMTSFTTSSRWSSDITDDYTTQVGSPIGTMYGYKNDGRYEVTDFDYDAATSKYTLKTGVANATAILGTVQPGYMKLKDLNGDGIIDKNDKSVIGNPNPKNTGGMTLSANAYGFDFSAAFNWSIGNDIYNANKVEFTTATQNGQYRNLMSEMAGGQRWTNINVETGTLVTDPAELTALNANTSMWSPYMKSNIMSDYAVEDGSFLRLNTLTLGYTAPELFTSKLGINKLRFYGTVTNVFVLTNYSGPDPEVSTKRSTPLTPGVDSGAYPRSRQFVFGLNLNF